MSYFPFFFLILTPDNQYDLANSPSSAIHFPNPDFISRLTSAKLFNQQSASSQFIGGPASAPPLSSSPVALADQDPQKYYSKPTIELSDSDGTFLVAYPSVVQLWEYSTDLPTGGGFCITGSTFGVNGKIIAAHFINHDHALKQPDEDVCYTEDTTNEGNDDDDNAAYSTSDYTRTPYYSRHSAPVYVLLQVFKNNDIQLQIHQLNKKPSFVKTLILPPASSGAGPYTVYTRHSKNTIAIVTLSGAITLFSVPDFSVLPLSGLETNLSSDGVPLFDICGRWLVYSPVKTQLPVTYTPLKLPPPGLLLDRVLENISSTTAASFKSITDAGVAGLRHYLAKDSARPVDKSKQPQRTSNSVIYVGSRKFSVDPSGTVAGISALPAALTDLFSSHLKSHLIQIIDLETQTKVSTFLSPQGLSYLSLSPFDALLATVSAKGESVYTFDLSFMPRQVSLNGKYVRGKTPAKVSHIEWDPEGGFGIITKDKGSVHWFERQRWNIFESESIVNSSSIANSNKIWRLSGWNVSDVCMVPNYISSEPELKVADSGDAYRRRFSNTSVSSETRRIVQAGRPVSANTKISMLRQGEIIIVDLHTGTCSWKYDVPSLPISETFLAPKIEIVEDTGSDQEMQFVTSEPEYRDLERFNGIEPVSFYEMESCLPYPFIHTDRHIILATYNNKDEADNEFCRKSNEDDGFDVSDVFGLSVCSKELDFGRAKGLATFPGSTMSATDDSSPSSEVSEIESIGPEYEDLAIADKELQHAMASLVIEN